MDASGNNSPDLVVTTQGTGPGELVYLAAGQQIAVSGISISGISISAGPQTTTQASTGVTGAFVWLAGSQTMSVQVSGIVPTTTASGLSGIAGVPVWVGNPSSGGGATATATSQSAMSTGLGVWLAPTQTVTAAISGVVPTTTASGLSGITGVPVWVGGGALSGGGATATATSQSAMSTALGVWFAPTQTQALLSTVLTVLGTVLVSAAGPISISGVAATTTASGLSGVTGLPVWVANPGSGSGATASATSQSAMSTALGVWLAPTQTISLVSTIVTVLGTQIVSVVPGLPVQISGIVPTTTASGLSGITGLPVWLVGGAGGGTTLISVVSTIVTILGFSVVTTSSQAGTASGLAVWVGNPSAAAAATVNISSVTPTTTVASGLLGLPVWFGNTILTVTGTITASVSVSVSVSLSGTVVFSGVVPTTTASGLSGVTGLPVWVQGISGAGATATATSQSAMSTALGVWLAQTQTMAVVSTVATVLGTVAVSQVAAISISGIVPTTTASGLSGVTGLPVWLVGGAGGGTTLISVVSTIITILGFSAVTTSSQAATASGLAVWVGNPGGAGSGATATATSQSAMSTALGVWLAQTQTLSLVSTIVTVLGTQIVSVVPGLSVSAVVPSITAVSTVVTLLGTVLVSAAAPISISGIAATTTASGLSGVTALPVWVANPAAVSGATATATSQSAMSTAIGVWLAPTQTLSLVSTIVTILGTQIVSVVPGLSVSAVVPSITAVSTIVTILGTQVVTVVPNLPVQISGITPTTTASGLSGVTGLPVWLVGGAGGGTTLISVVSTIVTILGFSVVTTSSQAATASGLAVWVGNPSGAGSGATATSQSAMSTAQGVWLAPTQTLSLVSTIVTLLGTVNVSQQGAGTVVISSVAPTTTQASGVTGLPVWLMASQTMAVSATISGSVNISGIVAVTDAVAGYTTASSGLTATATGQIVVATGTVTAIVVGTVSLVTVSNVGTISTILGTQVVSVVPNLPIQISGISPTTTASGLSGVTGLPVWMVGGAGGAAATATSQSAMSTALGVWLAQTQTMFLVSTVVTVLGTVLVSEAAAISISSVAATTTASGLSGVTGLPVWVGNTVSVTVSGSFQISGITPTTTGSGLSGVTGLPVWMQAVTIQQSAQVQVNIAGTIIYAAAASSSAGPLPFTINVGSTVATVTSAWTVPATNFRLYAVNLFVTGAGATTPTLGYFQVAYSSAGTTGTATSPTILSTKPQLVKIPIGAGPAAASFGIIGAQLDIGGGLTQTIMLWLNYPGTTGTSVTILFNMLGYLF